MRTMKRQGDVLLIPVDEIPAGLKTVPRDNGRVILAYGEATGHAHAVRADVGLFAADLEEMEHRFLRVEAELVGKVDAFKCQDGKGTLSWIPAYTPAAQIEAADYTILGREDVAGVVIEHEEHLHFVAEPGTYEVRRQREYQPDAIRFVAD
jgi:hypothetical protein